MLVSLGCSSPLWISLKCWWLDSAWGTLNFREHFVTRWLPNRWCRLDGRVSLGVSFEIQASDPFQFALSALCLWFKMWAFSVHTHTFNSSTWEPEADLCELGLYSKTLSQKQKREQKRCAHPDACSRCLPAIEWSLPAMTYMSYLLGLRQIHYPLHCF